MFLISFFLFIGIASAQEGEPTVEETLAIREMVLHSQCESALNLYRIHARASYIASARGAIRDYVHLIQPSKTQTPPDYEYYRRQMERLAASKQQVLDGEQRQRVMLNYAIVTAREAGAALSEVQADMTDLGLQTQTLFTNPYNDALPAEFAGCISAD